MQELEWPRMPYEAALSVGVTLTVLDANPFAPAIRAGARAVVPPRVSKVILTSFDRHCERTPEAAGSPPGDFDLPELDVSDQRYSERIKGEVAVRWGHVDSIEPRRCGTPLHPRCGRDARLRTPHRRVHGHVTSNDGGFLTNRSNSMTWLSCSTGWRNGRSGLIS